MHEWKFNEKAAVVYCANCMLMRTQFQEYSPCKPDKPKDMIRSAIEADSQVPETPA